LEQLVLANDQIQAKNSLIIDDKTTLIASLEQNYFECKNMISKFEMRASENSTRTVEMEGEHFFFFRFLNSTARKNIYTIICTKRKIIFSKQS
jgi:hypothetical protein